MSVGNVDILYYIIFLIVDAFPTILYSLVI